VLYRCISDFELPDEGDVSGASAWRQGSSCPKRRPRKVPARKALAANCAFGKGLWPSLCYPADVDPDMATGSMYRDLQGRTATFRKAFRNICFSGAAYGRVGEYPLWKWRQCGVHVLVGRERINLSNKNSGEASASAKAPEGPSRGRCFPGAPQPRSVLRSPASSPPDSDAVNRRATSEACPAVLGIKTEACPITTSSCFWCGTWCAEL
jgi:hypothetical protein